MNRYTDIATDYEAVANVSGCMLEAAKAGDWRRFAALEDDCTKLIAGLRLRTSGITLGKAEQRIRMRALRTVLANDACIRAITEPGIDRLLESLTLSPPSSA